MLLVPLPRRPDWRHPPLVTLAIMVLCTLIYFFWQIPGDKVQEQALDYYGKSVLREAELPAYLNYLSEQGGEKARRLRQAYAHDQWPLVLAAMENDGEFQLRLHRGQVITPHSPLYPQWQTARRHYEDLRNRAVTSRYAFTPTDPRPITWLSHMGEGQADAQIGNGQGGHLPPFQALAEKDHGNEHGEGGIGEQDEPFQPGGNVAQAVEIQQAGTVVAEYAQGREFEPFPGA